MTFIFGRWLATATVVALSPAGCSVIARTEDAQCVTDADCLVNETSRVRRPKCTAGRCKVTECIPPASADPEATSVSLIAILLPPVPAGRVPNLTDQVPLLDPEVTVHACDRDDPTCAYTSCGWQSPAISPVPLPAIPPGLPYRPSLVNVPVKLPFNGYFATYVADPTRRPGYLNGELFPQSPVTDATLKQAPNGILNPFPLMLFGGTDLLDKFAYSGGVIVDQNLGGLFIAVFEPGPTGIAPSRGASIKLITQSGEDARIIHPGIRSIFVNDIANVEPGVTTTVGIGVAFLNVPLGAYRVLVTKGERRTEGSMLAIVGSTTVMSLMLAPGGGE